MPSLEDSLERAAASGAFVALDADDVLAQARAAPPGPLHGVPVAVKDSIDVAGLPTRAGSPVPDDAPAREDAPLVARVRAAGAVVLGKTVTHELTIGVTTPGLRNPVDPARSAGGSSGGSAVAVAVGAAPLALGTDTAGSIRIPAALCGVAGLKARREALPTAGTLPLAPSMDAAGLLAPGAAGLARAWEALGGTAPPDEPPLLVLPDPPAPVEPVARAAWEQALERLGPALAVAVPPWEAWGLPRARTLLAEALRAHRERGWWPARVERYGTQARRYLEMAEALGEEDVARARAQLDELVAALRAAVAGGRVLVLPTTVGPAPPRSDDPGDALAQDARLTLLTGPANAADLAAVSVPAGRADDGLPLGLQLVAETEELALAAALATEREEVPA